MAAVDILILHGTVVTMDGKRRVIDDGAVAILKDRIVDVGTSAALAARHTARKTIDATGQAVMPGLVDAHAHAGHGFIKTLGGGDSKAWYDACGWATRSDRRRSSGAPRPSLRRSRGCGSA